MTDTGRPVGTESSRPDSRTARAGWGVMGLAWFVATSWLVLQFVSTTWDAGVLLVRGEVVAATVVEVDLGTKLGQSDELVVTTGPPHSGRAEITTRREDIPVGAVVEVVVDPDDTSRASLAEDGWPWYATLFPLFLIPFTALAALLTGGRALVGSSPDDDGDAPRASSGTPGGAGSGERT